MRFKIPWRSRVRPIVSKKILYPRLWGCAVPGCPYSKHAQGLCDTHYRQISRGALSLKAEHRGPRPAFPAQPLFDFLKHLSTADAARRLGISARHLRRVREAGVLTILTAEKYADALGLHPKTLWNSYPVPPHPVRSLVEDGAMEVVG